MLTAIMCMVWDRFVSVNSDCVYDVGQIGLCWSRL